MRATPKTLVRRLSITAAAAVLGLVASLPLGMAGCSNQGEGERCTFFSKSGDAGENGTSECASGLQCVLTTYYTSGMAVNSVGQLGVCCPPSGTPSTAAACQAMVGGSTGGGPPLLDGGFDGDTGASDAAADGKPKTDATLDAHTADARSDVSVDGQTQDGPTTDARGSDAKASGSSSSAPDATAGDAKASGRSSSAPDATAGDATTRG